MLCPIICLCYSAAIKLKFVQHIENIVNVRFGQFDGNSLKHLRNMAKVAKPYECNNKQQVLNYFLSKVSCSNIPHLTAEQRRV